MLRELAYGAVVELDLYVRKSLIAHDTDELSLNWIEIDSLNTANHGSNQAKLSKPVEEFAIIGVFKIEAGQSASS